MAEKITHKEHEHYAKALDHAPKAETLKDKTSHKEDNLDSIEAIRANIEHYAQKTESVKNNQNKETLDDKASYQSVKKIKQDAYNETLKSAQKKLRAPSRVFSKFIHNSIIESSSTVLEKSVARPKSILYGSFFAVIGSALLYFMAKTYGFSYNFFAYTVLYILFYLFGLVIEMLFDRLKRITKKN